MPRTVITPYRVKYIQENYLKEPSDKIGARFGISGSAVRRYMKTHGLHVPKKLSRQWAGYANSCRTSFTLMEDNYIRRHYLTVPIKRLARMMGRSDTGVKTRMHHLGLVIPKDIIEKRKVDSRIKPGTPPPNKGKNMTRQQYRKCAPTMFKPGNLPANTAYNGCIRIRNDKRGVPQKFIRIRKGKWEYLSRYNYCKFIGRIPKGMIVTFIDRNTLNCEPSNLRLMTKADNARRNAWWNYPPEVQEVIKLNNKLKKQINAKKQNR